MYLKKYLIPIDVVIESDMSSLERYIEAYESMLYSIAFEASINDSTDNLTSRAKSAGKKIIDGNRKHDETMVRQGSEEMSSVVNDLKKISNTTTDKSAKRRLVMIAKVIGAVIASVFLAIGFVTAGKKVKKMLSSGTSNSDVRDIHRAVQADQSTTRNQISDAQQVQRTESTQSTTVNQVSSIENNIIEVRNVITKGEPLLRDSDGSMKSFSSGTVLADGGVIKNIESAPEQGPDTRRVTVSYTGTAAKAKKIDNALDTGDFSKINLR